MRQARLLCLCSHAEGMPNVVAEALACGCPVIATSVGEIPYMLHEQNGIIVDPAEEDSQTVARLSTALRQALHKDYDHTAIAAATSHYRWEHAARIISKAIAPKPKTIDVGL
jgi:glycosyltransferase involved in cell wall biosynthesis